jgi:hypothetical protein
MNRAIGWALVAVVLSVGGCAGRRIFHLAGCEERLASPHKRQECVACLSRPLPHEFQPDNPDGMRCVRR